MAASDGTRPVSVEQNDGVHPLELLIDAPDTASSVFVFAHGAGAGMKHRFMQTVASLLAARSIAVIRFNFRYMTAGRSYPDRPPELYKAVDAAIGYARTRFPSLPVIAGGKSMGGRVTADAIATGAAPKVDGLVFFGYPLHAPGKPSTQRAHLLESLNIPMLFLQGSRDKLADPTLLGPIVESLPKASMHLVEEGDHSFAVPKRSGRSTQEVLEDLADIVSAWVARLKMRRKTQPNDP